MSEEGDTFWVKLAEKFAGLIILVIGAIMLYYTATSSGPAQLGAFTAFFGVLSVILIILGIFLLLVKAPE